MQMVLAQEPQQWYAQLGMLQGPASHWLHARVLHVTWRLTVIAMDAANRRPPAVMQMVPAQQPQQ
jgi:hypothetical protein